jgi:hypothetical protein
MKGHRGKKSINVICAKKGLLGEKVWKPILKRYPTSLVCLIRERLLKKIPDITEKFNRNSRYFGYWVGDDKDRVYIYVQKKQLVIDLYISTDSDFTTVIKERGFKIKPRSNFQGHAGWLTGWQVPQSTTDIDQIADWLCKAFKGDL